MQQVVDLRDDPKFQSMGIELLSISPDSLKAWREQAAQFKIDSPLLSDAGNRVATMYGVMRWKMPSNEPGHTFVLVDMQGRVAWLRDYGGMEHGGIMYVPPDELVPLIAEHL